jgi:peptidylprolyl isomerase
VIEFRGIAARKEHSLYQKVIVIGATAAMLLVSAAGCAPPIAENGDTVRVSYVGELPDGTVFDSSEGREPLQFTIGAGQVIAGFENAIVGMQPGESKTFTIPPEEGYGPYREDLVFHLPPSDFPPEMELHPGAVVTLSGGNVTMRGLITEVSETDVVVDANQPLAGETLVFHVELIEVVHEG